MARMVLAAAAAAVWLAACSKSSSSNSPPLPTPPPVQPPKPVAVAVGSSRTCALMDDGRVECLGYNGEGELGIGTFDFDAHDDPTVVASVAAAVALGASEWDTCALDARGVVKCWGRAMYGQLGSSAPSGTYIAADPVVVSTGATALGVGGMHTCFLVDAVAKCVGVAEANGSMSDSAAPVTVAGSEGTEAITGGWLHTCAIVNGRVKCWGDNTHGELGRVTTQPYERQRADFVANVGTVTAISARGYHACAVLADTTVKCWGQNTSGELGNGAASSYETIPVAVSGLSGAVAVAAGGTHTCALLQDGSVWCWGSNACWNLGTRTGTSSSTPVVIAGVGGGIAISAGVGHTCVLTSAGVKCWGCNNSGELGRHAKTEVPVDIPF